VSILEDEQNLANSIAEVVGRIMPEDFAKAMGWQHRTHQQLFTGLCIAWLEQLDKMGDRSDARNEASVKFAQKVMAATSPNDRILPYI
jgi:hypothetical protein